MRRWMMVLAGLMLVVGAACAPAPSPRPPQPLDQPATLPAACNRVAVRSCGLPFPSDQWTVRDQAAETGRRVRMSDEVISAAARAELPDTLTASSVFAGADGFSANTPAILETATAVDPASLPADGGDAFQVWDTTTGERVAILAAPDREADFLGAQHSILTAFPVTRYEFGHHYVAVLTSALRGPGGAAVPAGNRLAKALARPKGALKESLRFLAERGIKKRDVVALTDFTVRSEANVSAPLEHMLDTIRAADHPVRKVRATMNFLGIPFVSTIVTGQLKVVDFRDPNTGAIESGNLGAGRENWVDFVLTVPQSAATTPAPVVMYGHGIGVFKESMVITAGDNARFGAATIAIDDANHGSRAAEDGGYIFQLLQSKNADRLMSVVTQSVVDLESVRQTIETSLGSLDVAPFNLLRPTAADGKADLDVTRVHYQGTSMGSVLGSGYVANAPGLKSALFQVGGVGVINILTHSSLWETIAGLMPGFYALVPNAATPGEGALFTGLAQARLDSGDSINYVHRIPELGTPVLLMYDDQDQYVPNRGSDALIELAQLPRTQTPAPGETAAFLVPTDEIQPWLGNPIPLIANVADLATHVAFIGHSATTQRAWLEGALAH